MYVLTAKVNAYDQYGDYFIKGWLKKPTKKAVKKAIKDSNLHYKAIDLDLILETIEKPELDTRIEPTEGEDAWFKIKEIKDGK